MTASRSGWGVGKRGESTIRLAHQEDLIDMTAMVDIVFFLLIFFMVTTMESLQSVLPVSAPQIGGGSGAAAGATHPSAGVADYTRVEIDLDNQIWIDGDQIFADQDLRLRLVAERAEVGADHGVLIVGDEDASHGTLVRVLDIAMGAGVENIQFAITTRMDDELE